MARNEPMPHPDPFQIAFVHDGIVVKGSFEAVAGPVAFNQGMYAPLLLRESRL
jgi:hypothetical protein